MLLQIFILLLMMLQMLMLTLLLHMLVVAVHYFLLVRLGLVAVALVVAGATRHSFRGFDGFSVGAPNK
jgi:hypothetical protein